MWNKLGLIRESSNFASTPTAEDLGDKWKIYYAYRDQANQYHTTFVLLDKQNLNIIYDHQQPILELGKLGSFDESGIAPMCLVQHGGKKYLYYVGISIKKTVPNDNQIGLAISEDGVQFQKFEGPVLGKSIVNPYLIGSIWVIKDDVWKAWYMSGTEWQVINDKPEPIYHINYAESDDGIEWKNHHKGVVGRREKELGIVRATVIKEKLYHMWYSYKKTNFRTDKNDSYRIGYASSIDGINWNREDEEVNLISKEGWDSGMVEYPCVVKADNRLLMFYNGNEFGKTGFGAASLAINNRSL